MKKTFILAVALSGFVSSLIPSSAISKTVDGIVAVVNDTPITLYQLDLAMKNAVDELKQIANGKDKNEKFENYRSLALKKLIDDTLLEQELAQRSIVVTDDDVNKAIENVKERNKLTEQQLISELKSKGTPYDKYKVQLKEQLKRIKFMGQVIAPRVKVTDADLDDFFAKNQDQFGNYQSVEMAQIILPLAPDASDSQLAQAMEKAKEIIGKARGGDNFESLGQKYSIDPQTAKKASYEVSQLAPQIRDLLSSLSIGGVSDAVRSSMGIHIVKLHERKTLAGEEYQAIREKIREKVYEVKLEEGLAKYLDDLKEKSYIKINESGV